ncbi:MAG TPA: hemolysin III family protein [Clostridia bacterium]|nr:hemolysin III family protein [Clostridia bacterium]
MKNKTKQARRFTFGEELSHSVTHGVSALGVLVLMPIVYIKIYKDIISGIGNAADIVGVAIFMISIFMMFLMSLLYHIMEFDSKHKAVMKKLDHIFIYVAIAGSYTPIALSVFWPIPGYGPVSAIAILALQWSMVIFGVLYKSLAANKMPRASLAIYLVMGWTALLFFPLLVKNANPVLFWLILSGGAFYSAGTVFYALKRIKFNHMVWHIFVTLGAAVHMIGIGFFLHG